MIEWDDCLVLAADRWGEEHMRQAHHDVVRDAAPMPALCIIEDAAWTLAQKGWWGEEPDEESMIALRGCYLARREQIVASAFAFAALGQPSELASWFESDLDDAYFDLLPEIECFCGRAYKVTPEFGKWHTFIAVDNGRCLSDRPPDNCECGRSIRDIGRPEQLTLELATLRRAHGEPGDQQATRRSTSAATTACR